MSTENDIVLIYFENQPLVFARIEEILPDKKKDWYHVRLLILQLPIQTVTWILKDVYINGQEFTMDGKKMRLEKVIAPKDNAPFTEQEKKKSEISADSSAPGKIIPLSERKPRA
jgi:hypothetical protein